MQGKQHIAKSKSSNFFHNLLHHSPALPETHLKQNRNEALSPAASEMEYSSDIQRGKAFMVSYNNRTTMLTLLGAQPSSAWKCSSKFSQNFD